MSKLIFAKKSLGQNFLQNKHYLRIIAEAGQLAASDLVLEVGPGTGNLTEYLLASGAKVLAIEKDHRMIEILVTRFAKEIASGHLTLENKDILSIEAPKEPYKLIGNIPYYITGQIIRRFLSDQNQPEIIVFLLQKEVVTRIIARDGKESLLSLGVKAYGTPKLIATVSAGNFVPKPKVDSAILAIEDISHRHFGKDKKAGQRFFDLLKKGFAQKRKLLRSNLGLAEGILEKCDLPEKVRAEDLKIEEWLRLAAVIPAKAGPLRLRAASVDEI
jgi:16S rRNA (adenine1518-N6/adenine1519-N6)-dimethyltransferase